MDRIITSLDTDIITVPHPASGTVRLTGITHNGEAVWIEFTCAKAEDIAASLERHAFYARKGE